MKQFITKIILLALTFSISVAPITYAGNNITSVSTGDTTNYWLYILVLVIAVVAIALVIFLNTRKKSAENTIEEQPEDSAQSEYSEVNEASEQNEETDTVETSYDEEPVQTETADETEE